MNSNDFIHAYEPIPQALEIRVRQTLARLEEAPKPARRVSLRTAIVIIALVLALFGVAYAIFENKTVDIFGWMYGETFKEELEGGAYAPMGQSYQLGDVVYSVEDMVYKTEGSMTGLYGVVRIAPAKDSNVVVMSSDLSVDDPAGFLLHYGDTGQTISDEDPSYAELAEQRGARLLMARAAVNSISIDGVEYANCFGESWLPQEDGTLLGAIEISDELPYAESFEMNLWLSNWETTLDGIWLRDEPDSTWLKHDWIITVSPEKTE